MNRRRVRAYVPERPSRAAWRAMRVARRAGLPVRFFNGRVFASGSVALAITGGRIAVEFQWWPGRGWRAVPERSFASRFRPTLEEAMRPLRILSEPLPEVGGWAPVMSEKDVEWMNELERQRWAVFGLPPPPSPFACLTAAGGW